MTPKKPTQSYLEYVNLKSRWKEFLAALDEAGPKAIKKFDHWADRIKQSLNSEEKEK